MFTHQGISLDVQSICKFDWAYNLQVHIYYILSAVQIVMCAVG